MQSNPSSSSSIDDSTHYPTDTSPKQRQKDQIIQIIKVLNRQTNLSNLKEELQELSEKSESL